MLREHARPAPLADCAELLRGATAQDVEHIGAGIGDEQLAARGEKLVQPGPAVSDDRHAARASLAWVAEKGIEDEARTIARLRLAALQADAKQFDEALKTLDAATADGFEALVADRRGDILMAQGKPAEARAAYEKAWAAMSDKVAYRRLVEAKLTALGAAPGAAPAGAAASGATR